MGREGGQLGKWDKDPSVRGGGNLRKMWSFCRAQAPLGPRDSTKKGQEDLDEVSSSGKDAAHSGPPQALETYTRHLSGQPALAKVCSHSFLDSGVYLERSCRVSPEWWAHCPVLGTQQ